MPLLLPLVLLFAVLALGVLLGVMGMLRQPFLAPRPRPVFGWALSVRTMLLGMGLLLAVAFTAWRQPQALAVLGGGLGVGALLGTGSALTARLLRSGRVVQVQPRRVFAVLVSLGVLLRLGASVLDLRAGREVSGLLPVLGGLLGGYAFAHAVVLRRRLAHWVRLQAGA